MKIYYFLFGNLLFQILLVLSLIFITQFETWKSDGTGYVFNTISISNINNYNLGNATIGFGANAYGTNYFTQQKIDYWGWIQRVEPLGADKFPGAS